MILFERFLRVHPCLWRKKPDAKGVTAQKCSQRANRRDSLWQIINPRQGIGSPASMKNAALCIKMISDGVRAKLPLYFSARMLPFPGFEERDMLTFPLAGPGAIS